MDRERIPYAPPYRRKSIINEVTGLWHKEFWHSSTKRRKIRGWRHWQDYLKFRGQGKYFLSVSAIRHPSPSPRPGNTLSETRCRLKILDSPFQIVYKAQLTTRWHIHNAPWLNGKRDIDPFLSGAGVGNADDLFNLHGSFRGRAARRRTRERPAPIQGGVGRKTRFPPDGAVPGSSPHRPPESSPRAFLPSAVLVGG